MEHWGQSWAMTKGSTSDWIFVLLFPAFMLADWALVEVRLMLAVHHIACLLGQLVCAFATPKLFPFCFVGVVALEVGSVTCNLYCLYPSSTIITTIYLITISGTHTVALGCMVGWVRRVKPWGGKAFGLVLSLGLILLRQKEAIKAWNHAL